MVHFRDAAASSFVAKVWGEVFAHFPPITIKRHSSTQNWLFGLTERILYEHSPWCQTKLWACFWHCSSPVLPFPVFPEPGMSHSHPCTAHAFFPEHLSTHCQGFCRIFCQVFQKIWRTLAVGSIVKSRHAKYTTQNKRAEKISTSTQLRERYASSIINSCIVLLHLFYRWQHQSQKLKLCFIAVFSTIQVLQHFSFNTSNSCWFCHFEATYILCILGFISA
jgi:hypothetical protein